MKSIILPTTWNSPTTPPARMEDVLVKFKRGAVRVLYYEEGRWIDSDTEEPYFVDAEDEIEEVEGWAMIVQQ